MKQMLVFLGCLVMTATATAQTDWLRKSPEGSIGLEYLQPSFVNDGYSKLSGAVILLTGRWSVSEATKLIVEIPYVTATEEYTYSNYLYNPATNTYTYYSQTMKRTKSGISSIGFGAEFGSNASSSSGRMMVHIPVLPEENSMAGYVALLGDFPHFERYIRESIFLQGGYQYHPRFESGVRVSAGLEPLIWIPTSSQGNDHAEALLDYGAGVGYDADIFKLAIGVGSRWILTEEHLFSSKASIYHLTAEASIRIGFIEPGISYLRQLDKELNAGVRNTMGVRVRLLF